MSVWHADVDTPTLIAGSRVHVFGDHSAVRVLTADQLSIETPAGQRLHAMVLDRTGAALILSLGAGAPMKLSMIAEVGLAAAAPERATHQHWVVN